MALDTSDKLGDISTNTDEWIEPYFTDVYSPWETKGQLEVGKEVKAQATTAKKYCFAYPTSWQTISNATGTFIAFTNFETNDTWMSITNDRITFTAAGQYLISWCLWWDYNSTWSRIAYLRINAGTIFLEIYCAPNPSDRSSVPFSTLNTFASWDYIDMKWYQTSGGNLATNGGINKTFLSVHQL